MVQGIDYVMPKSTFATTFRTRIPSKKEWAANFDFRVNSISVFTDG